MRTLLRRIRGTVGIALFWSIPWAIIGWLTSVAAVYFFVSLPATFSRLATALQAGAAQAVGWGFLGFVTGSMFSAALSVVGRRKTLRQLSMRRFAAWGALAGAVPPATMVVTTPEIGRVGLSAVIFGLCAGLGAACAAGTLAIARAGAPDEREPSAPTPGESPAALLGEPVPWDLGRRQHDRAGVRR